MTLSGHPEANQHMKIENWKRVLAGLLIAYCLGMLAKYVPPTFGPDDFDTAEKSAANMRILFVKEQVWLFVALFFGGYVARRKFLVPAVLYTAAMSIYSVLIPTLSYSALDTRMYLEFGVQPPSFSEKLHDFLSSLLPDLGVMVAVAAIGSLAGMKLVKVWKSDSSCESRPE